MNETEEGKSTVEREAAAAEETRKAVTEEDGTENGKKTQKKNHRKKTKGKKRGRMITPLILFGIIIAGVAGCLVNIAYCKNNFDVNFYQAETLHVAADIRIVVISDVHMSEFGENNEELVNETAALHPDLIISAGDLVTYGTADYESMLSLCRSLAKIAPFYGIMGNHEDEKTFLEHDETMRERFAETGMKLLVNTCEKIKINNNNVELVGVSGGTEEYDLYGGRDTMEALDEKSTALRICCAHVPTLFKERLEQYSFDLGIAGHTHGGIIRLPVLGGLYSAEEGFLPEMDGGMVRLANGADLFVSRGLGNSGIVPRFNNTPELAVIDVRWY